ncbi:hydrolase [Citrobacter freundii]|nr:hydrolase [Citrobacter freundii]
MTTEQGPRAVLREDTVPFLDALKASGKRRILLTNAHPHNLAVKLEHTGLASHLDLLLSTPHIWLSQRGSAVMARCG